MIQTFLNRWKSNWVIGSIYLYIALPFFFFFYFWIKRWISIPVILLLSYFLYQSFRNEKISSLSTKMSKKWKMTFIFATIIIFVYVVFSGIGEYVWQYGDHPTRNAIFKTLATNGWPTKMEIVGENGQTYIRGLSYYLIYWLPAAFVGLKTNYDVARFALFLWSLFGVLLTYYLLCERHQNIKLWYLFLFMGFSGLDYIGGVITNWPLTNPATQYEWWSTQFQFSSFTTQLYWVYNQAIYGWIFYYLIMRQQNSKSLIFLLCLSAMLCPFPAVGLIPFVLYKILSYKNIHKRKLIKYVGDILSYRNVFGICIGLFALLFLMGGASSNMFHIGLQSKSATQSYPFVTLLSIYILFIVLEVGIYYFVIYQTGKNRTLLWLSFGFLLVCPWIHIGRGADFCMRASIPALLCLMDLVIDALEDLSINKDKWFYILVTTVLIGSISAFNTFKIPLTNTFNIIAKREPLEIKYIEQKNLFTYGNFSTDAENSGFYKYFARNGEFVQTNR